MTWNHAAHPARFCAAVGAARSTLFPLDRSSANQSAVVPYFFGRRNPLMTEAFLAALLACGVDTLAAEQTELYDADDQRIPGTWMHVTVLARIAAADLEHSIAVKEGVGYRFDQLVIDPTRTRGARMFRLAEDPTHVWVDELVRTHLHAHGFHHLRFWRPTQVASL